MSISPTLGGQFLVNSPVKHGGGVVGGVIDKCISNNIDNGLVFVVYQGDKVYSRPLKKSKSSINIGLQQVHDFLH